jgi:hypothetical protein
MIKHTLPQAIRRMSRMILTMFYHRFWGVGSAITESLREGGKFVRIC